MLNMLQFVGFVVCVLIFLVTMSRVSSKRGQLKGKYVFTGSAIVLFISGIGVYTQVSGGSDTCADGQIWQPTGLSVDVLNESSGLTTNVLEYHCKIGNKTRFCTSLSGTKRTCYPAFKKVDPLVARSEFRQEIIDYEPVFKQEQYTVDICTNTTVEGNVIVECTPEIRERQVVDESKRGNPLYSERRQTSVIVNNKRYGFDTSKSWVCGQYIATCSDRDGGHSLEGRTLCLNNYPVIDSGESCEIRKIIDHTIVQRRSDVGTI